jgi:hypothetical protein
MGPILGRFHAGVLAVLALGFLAGCAASRPGEKKDDPAGVSVHLPALEPMDIETRTQPPVVQPALVLPPPYPDDVEEGKARSLRLLDIHHGGGQPSRPPSSAPPEALEKP